MIFLQNHKITVIPENAGIQGPRKVWSPGQARNDIMEPLQENQMSESKCRPPRVGFWPPTPDILTPVTHQDSKIQSSARLRHRRCPFLQSLLVARECGSGDGDNSMQQTEQKNLESFSKTLAF